MSRIEHPTRILRSPHLVRLGNLLDSRIKIERVNSIELKLDPTITLRITSESKKDNATRIATTITILIIIYLIKYRAIVVVLLLYLIRFTIKNFFILLRKILEIIKLLLLI